MKNGWSNRKKIVMWKFSNSNENTTNDNTWKIRQMSLTSWHPVDTEIHFTQTQKLIPKSTLLG